MCQNDASRERSVKDIVKHFSEKNKNYTNSLIENLDRGSRNTWLKVCLVLYNCFFFYYHEVFIIFLINL